jgi:hypothetical protein
MSNRLAKKPEGQQSRDTISLKSGSMKIILTEILEKNINLLPVFWNIPKLVQMLEGKPGENLAAQYFNI